MAPLVLALLGLLALFSAGFFAGWTVRSILARTRREEAGAQVGPCQICGVSRVLQRVVYKEGSTWTQSILACARCAVRE